MDGPQSVSRKYKKITPAVLMEMKRSGEIITALTAYDADDARLLEGAAGVEGAGIEITFVNDTFGMTRLGYKLTRQVTLEEVVRVVREVKSGISRALLVGEMSYGSYETTDDAVRHAKALWDAGADAVKLQGGEKYAPVVSAIVKDTGIPVIGHIGHTPLTKLKAFVEGRNPQEATQLMQDALALQRAGAAAIVIELVDRNVVEFISNELTLPVIGMGAGSSTHGQMLVIDDLLGRYPGSREWDMVGRNLAANLQRNGLSPVYLVSGDEPLLLKETIDEIREFAKNDGFNERIVLDANTGFEWNTLLQEGASLSLFSSRRLIELRLGNTKPVLASSTIRSLKPSFFANSLISSMVSFNNSGSSPLTR